MHPRDPATGDSLFTSAERESERGTEGRREREGERESFGWFIIGLPLSDSFFKMFVA